METASSLKPHETVSAAFKLFCSFLTSLSLQRIEETYQSFKASLVAQLVNLPAMWETRVRSLGQEDPLEKEMPTTPSTLARRIPQTEEPGRPQSMGLQGRIRLND